MKQPSSGREIIGQLKPILPEPARRDLIVKRWHNASHSPARVEIVEYARNFLFSRSNSRSPMSDAIVHVNDANFDNEVLQSVTPVLVDYWAEWCGPCKMIAPILEDVARDYSGKLKIAKLNIDENQGTPPKYGIRGIPTLMLFKNGNVEATKVGALSKTQLAAFIDANI
jgi:thioredoxin 1